MVNTKLSDKMRERSLLSFELFPPKTEKGLVNLSETILKLKEHNPAYMSVTYGAGGTNVGKNKEVLDMISDAGMLGLTHLTCIGNSKESIREQLCRYSAQGIDHVLALRGDLPMGWTDSRGDFKYATDLVAFIRKEFGTEFEIAVAGSPEGHVQCRSLESDVAVLKQKQDNGADFIITQLCWDMEQFKRWQDMLDKAGVTIPIVVGVMPVLDPAVTINSALSHNACVMPRKLCELLSKYWIFPNPFTKERIDPNYDQKKADFKKAGMEYTVRQLDEYRILGINGIHMYTLNKWKDISDIIEMSGMNTVI